MDENMIGMCGANCKECDWREVMECKGCQKSNGKLFWGECRVANCSSLKDLKHCGHCNELPCEKLQMSYDKMEQGDDGERMANLMIWKEASEKNK
jgi:hypothetical protein